jgi:S1-C subfamily serine protease
VSRQPHTRRTFLAAVGTAAAAGLAGCTGGTGGEAAGEPSEATRSVQEGQAASGEPFAAVYEQVVGSVVQIQGFDADGRVGQGSGFVAFDDVVVTNQHVVAGTSEVVVGFTDGSTATGEVLGTDVYADLAAIDVAVPDGIDPLSFVEREPPVGTQVMAVGAPFGLGESASSGIVSGVDRSLPSRSGFTVPDALQTDAAVNPGNSGGPLVTLDGEVVGVITAGGGENIAFAISAAMVERVVPDLVVDGEYDHSFIGVGLRDLDPPLVRANEFGRSTGVYVNAVLEDGPAAGVLQGSTGEETELGVTVPTGGDLILGLDGQSVQSLADLSTYLALNTRPGDLLSVTVLRDGTRRTLSVTLGERPEA